MEEKKSRKITKQQIQSAQHIFAYIKPYKGYFALGMLFLALTSIVFMVLPAAVGQMLKAAQGDTLIPYLNINISIYQYWLVFLGILVFQGILSFLRVNAFAYVTENSLAQIRKDLYKKLLAQYVEFFENNRVGEISSRMSADVEKLHQAFTITLPEFLRQVIVFTIGVVILFIYSPELTLFMLLSFPPVIIVALIFGRYIKKLAKQRQDYLAETNVVVEETFQSFHSVKTYVNEFFEFSRYGKKMDQMITIALKYARAKGIFFTFIITGLFGALFFLMWYAGIQLHKGVLEIEDITIYIFYAMIIGGAIAGLGNQYTELLGALGATERVKEILDRPQELSIDNEQIKPIDFNQEIIFDQVHFSYPTRKDVQVLKDINIKVNKGQKIALVGSSGSGKSTIIKLLTRFYDLDKGAILIDQQNIADLNVKSLRSIIGVVPQEVILFGGTILENIKYGKLDASFEEVIEAARQANALGFIEKFPEQFETIVGERGVQLSGGQKQRIAIARAILKNPSILILDEATSSLDAESEKQVQNALEQLMQNRTTFIIAHRLSTVKNADEILVIKDGEILERGKHQDLIQQDKSAYNQLLKLQLEH